MQKRQERLKEQAWRLMCYDAMIRETAGITLLAGVDEVGRGSLAGPLVAAAVIMPDRLLVTGIDDSKALSPAQRTQAARLITRVALSWSVVFVSPKQIDSHGIQAANMAAMRAAVLSLSLQPELVLSDGYRIRDLEGPQRAVVQGDRISQSIAAASCLAKAIRDRWMQYLGEELYPGYGWERNAGYATQEHRLAVTALGLSDQHRLTFINGSAEGEDGNQLVLPFF
jgi:ribonuclease HII